MSEYLIKFPTSVEACKAETRIKAELAYWDAKDITVRLVNNNLYLSKNFESNGIAIDIVCSIMDDYPAAEVIHE